MSLTLNLIVGNHHQIAVLAFYDQVIVVCASHIVGHTVTDAHVPWLLFSNLYTIPVPIES
jgi:hypothetical protein